MREKLRRWLPAIAVFFGGLVLWEGAVRVFDIQGFILPAPSAILAALVAEADELSTAAIGTFSTALAGLVVGAVVATLAAFAAARWPLFREGAMPAAVALNSTPIIVLAPVANAWFGLRSAAGTIFVVAVLVFFPLMINLVRGLLSADAAHMELMDSYASGRRTILWKLQFPTSLPFLFSALKVAAALSLIGAIVKEYFGGSQERLGQYITSKAGLFQFEEAWAAIVVASAFGIFLYALIVLIERRVMPWHVSVRHA